MRKDLIVNSIVCNLFGGNKISTRSAWLLANLGVFVNSGGYYWRNKGQYGEYISYGEFPVNIRTSKQWYESSFEYHKERGWSIPEITDLSSGPNFPKIRWHTLYWSLLKSKWPRCGAPSAEGGCLEPKFHRGHHRCMFMVWDDEGGIYGGRVSDIAKQRGEDLSDWPIPTNKRAIMENANFEKWYLQLEKYASDEYGWTITGLEKPHYKDQFDEGFSPVDAIENTMNET